jgi:hypothetical protein
VLVVGGVHVAAQLVGGLPESGLEAKVGAVFRGFRFTLFGARHAGWVSERLSEWSRAIII